VAESSAPFDALTSLSSAARKPKAMIPRQMTDISHAEPAKYDATIISSPPTSGTQEACFLP